MFDQTNHKRFLDYLAAVHGAVRIDDCIFGSGKVVVVHGCTQESVISILETVKDNKTIIWEDKFEDPVCTMEAVYAVEDHAVNMVVLYTIPDQCSNVMKHIGHACFMKQHGFSVVFSVGNVKKNDLEDLASLGCVHVR